MSETCLNLFETPLSTCLAMMGWKSRSASVPTGFFMFRVRRTSFGSIAVKRKRRNMLASSPYKMTHATSGSRGCQLLVLLPNEIVIGGRHLLYFSLLLDVVIS